MISSARLEELEAIADGATQGRRRLERGAIGRGFNARQAVAMIAGGRVEAAPNLRYEGRRVSGLFEPGTAYPQVWFEAYELPRRQRFTVAHELGHFYLDPLRGSVCDPSQMDVDPESVAGEQDVHEEEADAFAAAFLIPSGSLLADLRRFGRCTAFLADLYDVSEPTMRRRLRGMELIAR